MKEKWFKDRKVPEEKRFRWSQITQHASLSLLTRVGVVLGVTMETAEGSSVEVKKEGEDEWIAGVKRNHSSTGSPRCGASGRAVVCHNGRTSRDEICIFMSITHTHTHMLTSGLSSGDIKDVICGCPRLSGDVKIKRFPASVIWVSLLKGFHIGLIWVLLTCRSTRW